MSISAPSSVARFARVPRGPLPLAVVGSDLEVPLVNGERRRYVNLDCAATAPCLASVRHAVDTVLPWYGSVHRGAGFASRVMTELFASARDAVSTFVGARSDDTTIFTRGTTDALNLLASIVPADTTVIGFASEHHANLLPWRRLDFTELAIPTSHDEAVSRVEDALRARRGGPCLVTVTGASNVTGELFPLEELVRLAHAHDARIAIDAAQLAAHRPIDLAALGADYLALSGHKLHAPFGAGVLVGRSDWLDAGQPYLDGGGAVTRVSRDEATFTIGHARHEAGTPNAIGAVALAAACHALREVGFAAIEAHEEALLARLTRGLAEIPGLVRYSMFGESSDRIGVAAFNLCGFDHDLLAAVLSAEYGIGVRDGAFCAHQLVRSLTRSDSGAKSGAVRVSVGASTSQTDVERLLSALREIATHGARWSYRTEGSAVVVDRDPRRSPALAGLFGGGTFECAPIGSCTASL